MSDIILFQFTTQEENIITDFLKEILPLSINLLKNGVRSNHLLETNALDIISYILNNIQNDRGNEMKFAISEIKTNHGRIKVVPNNMDKNSIQFLENILNAQLEYYQQNIHQALEYANKNGFDLKSKPLTLQTLPILDTKEN